MCCFFSVVVLVCAYNRYVHTWITHFFSIENIYIYIRVKLINLCDLEYQLKLIQYIEFCFKVGFIQKITLFTITSRIFFIKFHHF